MKLNNVWRTVRSRLKAQWIACRLISSRKSAQYGIRFSYPLYISFVLLGVVLKNPYILSIAALIALLGIVLPMHPLDYVYNHVIAKFIRTATIPGRGSELQANSYASLVFTIFVITLILFKTSIHYHMLAIIYLISSIFFLSIFLFRNDSFRK